MSIKSARDLPPPVSGASETDRFERRYFEKREEVTDLCRESASGSPQTVSRGGGGSTLPASHVSLMKDLSQVSGGGKASVSALARFYRILLRGNYRKSCPPLSLPLLGRGEFPRRP